MKWDIGSIKMYTIAIIDIQKEAEIYSLHSEEIHTISEPSRAKKLMVKPYRFGIDSTMKVYK
jgi:hypothetical protein